MKEIELTITCTCGFWVQRVFYTNEYGYFEIPDAYCPACFQLLVWSAMGCPMDVIEMADNKKEI